MGEFGCISPHHTIDEYPLLKMAGVHDMTRIFDDLSRPVTIMAIIYFPSVPKF